MLLETLAAIGAAIVGVAMIHVILITLSILLDWFAVRKYVIVTDPDNIAFTVKDHLDSGNYRVVQGIFNKKTTTVKDKRVMEAEELDEDVKKMHEKDILVVYEE